MTLHKNAWQAALLALHLFTASCQKKIAHEETLSSENKTITANAIKSTWSVNWNNYGDGTYTSSLAANDFGNVSGWNDSRAWISGGTCRIKLLKNALVSLRDECYSNDKKLSIP